uniref:Cathepsin propeptide inhibitor domain-containing protein n=1 Tax=Acrobeloides nanus TaxID=290746 RepID=A0A914CT60_9BILA
MKNFDDKSNFSIESQEVESAIAENEYYQEFAIFIREYNKVYENVHEFEWRFQVFVENLNKLKTMQSNNTTTATFGISQFLDHTEDELKKMLMPFDYNLINEEDYQPIRVNDSEYPSREGRPKEVDWRAKNVVTQVKNQGSCGSCWAFAVTAVIESQNAIHNKKLVP